MVRAKFCLLLAPSTAGLASEADISKFCLLFNGYKYYPSLRRSFFFSSNLVTKPKFSNKTAGLARRTRAELAAGA